MGAGRGSAVCLLCVAVALLEGLQLLDGTLRTGGVVGVQQ